MKTPSIRSICSYLLAISGIVMLERCAAVYQPVYPEKLVMYDQRWIGPDTTVEIELWDHVLEGPNAKRYARMAKRNGVNLIALRIGNYGHCDLRLPLDLKMYTREGDTLSILAVEEGLASLVEVLTFDHSNSLVGVETDPAWIGVSWRVVNDLRKLQSHIRFVKNISNAYFKDCVLHPGQQVSGFVILRVKKNTPVQFSIQ